jgi:hypothetical protein
MLDHIVVICAELELGIAWFRELSGVTPVYGGAHATGRTHNALVGLGGRRYLEILAPLAAPSAEDDDWTRLAHATPVPRVLTYCERPDRPLAELAAFGKLHGWPNSDVVSNGRTTPDGVRLRWQWLSPRVDEFGYAFPFFIDWLDSVHPSDSLRGRAAGDAITLHRFAVGHPSPERLASVLAEVSAVEETFTSGRVSFALELKTPKGTLAVERPASGT